MEYQLSSYKPSKELATKLAGKFSEASAELLLILRALGGNLKLPPQWSELREKVRAAYIPLYEDEKRIAVCAWCAFLGREGFKEILPELSRIQPQDFPKYAEELCEALEEIDLERFFPPSCPQARKEAERLYAELSEENKKIVGEFVTDFWSLLFVTLHNALSVMVHGETLTSLVKKALAGDQEPSARPSKSTACY